MSKLGRGGGSRGVSSKTIYYKTKMGEGGDGAKIVDFEMTIIYGRS